MSCPRLINPLLTIENSLLNESREFEVNSLGLLSFMREFAGFRGDKVNLQGI